MRDDPGMDPADDGADIRDLLRTASPALPLEDVDWTGLHARITTRAAPLLAHSRSSWWLVVADWSARGVPLAAAAAVLLLIAMGVMQQSPAATIDTFVTVEEELAGSSAAFLVAAGDADDVIDALLFYEEE